MKARYIILIIVVIVLLAAVVFLFMKELLCHSIQMKTKFLYLLLVELMDQHLYLLQENLGEKIR